MNYYSVDRGISSPFGTTEFANLPLLHHDIDPERFCPYVSAMAKLDIITLPDPLLRTTSSAVERVDDEICQLMDDMLETMYVAPGIGLAAVQVGIPKRLIVVDVGEPQETTTEPDGEESS